HLCPTEAKNVGNAVALARLFNEGRVQMRRIK
ncbi:MAG: hypothetical protein ACI92C_002842, partial [Neolewinella sp.]